MSSEEKTLPKPSPTDSMPSTSRNVRDLMLPHRKDHEAPLLPKQQAVPLPPPQPPRFPDDPKKTTFNPPLTGTPKLRENQDKASEKAENCRKLMEDIRKGVTLRKVPPEEINQKKRGELQAVVLARRKALAFSDTESDNEKGHDDHEWD